MTYQSNWNGYLAIKAQSAKGTAASGSGAAIIPINGGNGLRLAKKAVSSGQVRQDRMTIRGRHGTQGITGAWNSELQLNNFDTILAAVIGASAWTAAPAAITQATGAMSSATISVSGSVVTASGGSFITAGVKVFDTHMWASGVNSADQNRPLNVVAVTANTITYAQTLTTVAGPVSTWSVQAKGHSLINPAAGSIVKPWFTIEEYNADIDQSIVVQDFVFGKIDMTLQPDGMFMFNPSGVGTGQVVAETTGASPYFTTPTISDQIPLSSIDAQLYLSDIGAVPDLTAFSLTMDLGLTAPAVVAADFSPDVPDSPMKINLSMTTLRDSLTRFSDFLNEATLGLSIMATVPGSSPTDFMTFSVPNFTLGSADGSGFTKGGGLMTEVLTVPADLVGKDIRGGAFDPTMIKVQRST